MLKLINTMRNIFDFFRHRPKMQALKSSAGDRQIVRRPYLCNAISLQMVKVEGAYSIEVTPTDSFPVDCVSAIGHADMATVLGVSYNRMSVSLYDGDEAYIAQVCGGRLPEGAKRLPAECEIRIYRVVIRKKS
jgi:hypothetical protein